MNEPGPDIAHNEKQAAHNEKQAADNEKRASGSPQDRVARSIVMLTILQLLVLALLVIVALKVGVWASAPAAVSVEKRLAHLQKTAEALADEGLHVEAAKVWEETLDSIDAPVLRASMLEKVGMAYLQGGAYAKAAGFLIEAKMAVEEQMATLDDPPPQDAVDRLDLAIDRAVAAAREQADDHSVPRSPILEDGRSGVDVVLTIRGRPYTEADIARLIEQRIRRVLATQRGLFDEALVQENLRAIGDDDELRNELTRDVIRTLLFKMRAEELGLDDDSLKMIRNDLVRNVLAERFFSEEIDRRAAPTEIDLQNLYEADKEQFRQPESAQVVPLPLDENETADDVLAQIESADDFRKLARKRRKSTDDGSSASLSRRVFRGVRDDLLGRVDAVFDLDPGGWTKTTLATPGGDVLVLVEEKYPPTTATLDDPDVRQFVRNEYLQRKRQELLLQTADELARRYELKVVDPAYRVDDVSPPESSMRPPSPPGGDGPANEAIGP